jgi:hypothetical protein
MTAISATGVQRLPVPPSDAPSFAVAGFPRDASLSADQFRLWSEPLRQAMSVLFATSSVLPGLSQVQTMAAMAVVVQHQYGLSLLLAESVVERMVESAMASGDPVFQTFGFSAALRISAEATLPRIRAFIQTSNRPLPILESLTVLDAVPPQHVALVSFALRNGSDRDAHRLWALKMVPKLGALALGDVDVVASLARVTLHEEVAFAAQDALRALSRLPEAARHSMFLKVVSQAAQSLPYDGRFGFEFASYMGRLMLPHLEAQLRGPNAMNAAYAIGMMGPEAFDAQYRVASNESLSSDVRKAAMRLWEQTPEIAPRLAALAIDPVDGHVTLVLNAVEALLELDRRFPKEIPGAMAVLEFWAAHSSPTPHMRGIVTRYMSDHWHVVVPRLISDLILESHEPNVLFDPIGLEIDPAIPERAARLLRHAGLPALEYLVEEGRKHVRNPEVSKRIGGIVRDIAAAHMPEFINAASARQLHVLSSGYPRALAEYSIPEMIDALSRTDSIIVTDRLAYALAQLGPAAIEPLQRATLDNPVMAERAQRVFAYMGRHAAEAFSAHLAARSGRGASRGGFWSTGPASVLRQLRK